MLFIIHVLFDLEMIFSKKWVIFQKLFFIIKFPIFGSNFKWIKKQFPNVHYLACCEIELFSQKKKNSRKNI